MKLDINNWKEYRIDKLFCHFATGKANQTILTEGNDFFYVGATRNNNGVMVHCKHDEPLTLKGNCIVFICNGEGSVGYANYMDRDFIASTDLVAGYMDNLNYLRGCFLATVLSQERPKYSFGRKWKTHLKNTIIKLPSITNKDGTYEPDWQFMEDYIKSLHYKPLTTKNKADNVSSFDVKNWKDFKLSDLFKISGSKTTPLEQLEEYGVGKYPYVTTQAVNNGIENFYNYYTEYGNCITVDSAVLGYCAYQETNFSASDHVEILRPRSNFNKYIGLFIVTILNKEQYRYSYGRKCSQTKLKNTIIKLPAIQNQDGLHIPDWEYMENYIKSLPYGDRI